MKADFSVFYDYTDFQVAFEGVVGKSYTGDIALDDISISKEKCPASGWF